MLQNALTATIAFIVTNLDDFAVLILLSLQAPKLWRETIVGQYLGFGILVGMSLPGFWLGQFPLKPWIGILGFVPIALGLRAWLQPEDLAPSSSHPITPTPIHPRSNRPRLFRKSPQIGLVASLTIANGGDNIAVYTSLFSSMRLSTLSLTLILWAIGVLVWCLMARYCAAHPRIQPYLTRYQKGIVPIVLIFLGFSIIATALT